MALSAGMIGGSYGPGGRYKPPVKKKPPKVIKPKPIKVSPYPGQATKPPPPPKANYGGSAYERGGADARKYAPPQSKVSPVIKGTSKAQISANTKSIQRQLNAKGAHLVVDGIWGPKTQAAYNKYWNPKPVGKSKPAPKAPPKAPAPRAPKAPARPAGGGGKPAGGGGGGTVPGLAAPRAATGLSSKAQEADDAKRARSSVDMVLNPMLNEIKRQGNTMRSSYDRMTNDEKARAKRQQDDLQEIYKRLGQYITNNKNGTDAVYDEARRNIKDAYAHLQETLDHDYTKSRQGVTNETARLGIGQANAAATEGNERDQKLLQGLASINATNADRGIETRKSAYGALQSFLGSEAAAEGGSRKAEGTRVSNKRLSDIAFERTNKVGELEGKYADLAGTRGERVKQAMDAIKNARDEKEAEAAQQEFMNYITGQKLGVEQGKLALATQTAQANAVRADKKLADDAAYRKAQLAISKTNAQTSRIKATQTATKQAKVPAYKAAGSYIEQNLGKGSKRTQDVQAIFNLILSQDNGKLSDPKGPKQASTGLLGYNVDVGSLGRMMAAGKRWLADNHYKAAEEKVLYNALLRYFGKF